LEISIVDRPANPDCRFEIDKIAKAESGAYLVKTRPARSPAERAVRKMAQAVELVTKSSSDDDYARDGFSKPVKEAATDSACDAHGVMNCPTCAEKRDVGTGERKNLAGEGKALPDGSFPIANTSDLANARQAVGRAKNPGKARAFIRQRAQALGVKLPDTWNKKMAKRLIKAAEKALKSAAIETSQVNVPNSVDLGFLTLPAEPSQSRRLGKSGGAFGHERTFEGEGREFLSLQESEPMDLISKRKVKKMVDTAEGNEALGQMVADIIKAGKMPSRADRMNMARGNLKKAKKASGNIAECMKAAHGILKAAYLAKSAQNAELAKAGKKPVDDADTDDIQKAMQQIHKAHGDLMTLKTFIKGASVNIKKAAGRISAGGRGAEDSGPEYSVPSGVRTRSISDLTHAGPGEGSESGDPPLQDIAVEWQHKSAKIDRMEKRGYISTAEAQALIRAAAAEAQTELLLKMPAAGQRPYSGGAGRGLTVGGTTTFEGLNEDLLKGVNPNALVSEDKRTRENAIAKTIGNSILGGHGRSIMDPEFQGAGGI
jgi:hypothetical protein